MHPQPTTHNSQLTIVSAPGKINLLGEHTVVYGKPALIAAIDRRLYVEIKFHKNEEIKIITQEDKKLVWQTIEIIKKFLPVEKLPSLKIKITSSIPTGSGLGSSAALSAALIGALMRSVKGVWNPNKINELSFKVEKIAHGNPSGADNTIVVFGGLVWFRREFDFLKSIWSLPVLSYKIPSFLLIDTGRPVESTKEMVMRVARFFNKNKKEFVRILNDQEEQTKRLLLSLKTGDREELLKVITHGERNLEKLGVVGLEAQKIIRKIESLGGAAKICGAGGYKEGSGIILCYHPDLIKLKNLLSKFPLPWYPVKLGEEGVRIEK